ncbi:MAG: flagellar hook-basal body complex protein FliE [Desulfohalobiaceae bacterium]|nr:flagellar hook-basal body complex protein FliE [Desulfohalobiaceae bacterium]
MSDGISGIGSIGQIAQSIEQTAQQKQQGGEDFLQTLKGFVQDTAAMQDKANQSIEDFSAGKETSVHEVMINMEKAGFSLQLMSRMRSEAMDAYDKIMRLRV